MMDETFGAADAHMRWLADIYAEARAAPQHEYVRKLQVKYAPTIDLAEAVLADMRVAQQVAPPMPPLAGARAAPRPPAAPSRPTDARPAPPVPRHRSSSRTC